MQNRLMAVRRTIGLEVRVLSLSLSLFARGFISYPPSIWVTLKGCISYRSPKILFVYVSLGLGWVGSLLLNPVKVCHKTGLYLYLTSACMKRLAVSARFVCKYGARASIAS